MKKMIRRFCRANARVWLTLFFAVLTLAGLIVTPDYGQPWDEPWEMDILRMNINQYRAALGDERRTPLKALSEPTSGLIADSVERDHGISAYYPIAWLVTDEAIDEGRRMTLWHAYTWLWFMLGVGALYAAAREMGLSRPMSCVGCLLLYFSPRFFAEGHYNNKDMVLLSLTLCMLASGMRLMKRPTLWRAMPFALTGALAANTKLAGLALWGLCALIVLLRQLLRRAMTRRVACVALGTAALFAALFVLLTPAVWSDPLGYLRYMMQNTLHFTRWTGDVLFRGAVFTPSIVSLPWYYLPVMMTLTLPLWMLCAAVLGVVATGARILQKRAGRAFDDEGLSLLMACLCWLLPLLYAMLSRPLIYNGWRHFYFLYAGLALTAAYGLSALWHALRMRTFLRRASAAALALCMLFTCAQSIQNHPNEFVYYNPLASLKGVEGRYEQDYWNLSVRETLLAWLSKADGDGLSIGGVDLWSQAGLEKTLATLADEQRARVVIRAGDAGEPSRFLLVNENYTVYSGWSPQAGMRLVARVSAYGRAQCSVYEREATP